MLNKLLGNREPYEPQDILLICKDDGTADIAPVLEINHERIHAESADGPYSVPLSDVKAHTGRKGRIFLYPSTVENVTDCQNIARLERSTVLRQITHYADQTIEPVKLPMMKIMMIGGGVLLLIIMLMVK
jgi:hypothetical protein